MGIVTRVLHSMLSSTIFCQRDLSITDYCRKFKSMVDALTDLGETVTNRTLVLNALTSLAERLFQDRGWHWW